MPAPSGPGLGRTLRTLLLALLNATLILLALCLWLGWQALSEARAIATEVQGATRALQPLQAELAGLRAEVAGLRGDLDGVGRAPDGSVAADLAARGAGLDARLADGLARLDAMADDPARLVDQAVDRIAAQIKAAFAACAGPAA